MPPSHLKVALIKSRIARKAIRFTAMLATRPMLADAPLLAASRRLRSSLWYSKETLLNKPNTRYKRHHRR